MTVHASLVSGPIGPDAIDLPGEPARLRSASQELRELARQVEQVGQQLQQVNPPEGARGRTATAMSRGARNTAQVLEADAQQLGELADALDGAADSLADGQGGLDALRQRWRTARESFRGALQGGKHGTQDPGELMRRIDANASEQHETQFQRQAGLTFLGGGGGGGPQAEAMLVDAGGEIQQAVAEYRREVRGIVDEFAGLMQKAKTSDNDLDARLPRRAGTAFAQQLGDTDGEDPDHANVSAPGTVQSIGAEMQDAAQTLARAADRLEDIRLAIRAGRMLPEDERMGSNDGFHRDWTDHFDSLREGLNATRRAGDAAAERLRQIDLDSAADIRQALRNR